MDITFDLLPDPVHYPMLPSVEGLQNYLIDLDEMGNAITFEWATNEIKNHLFGYVRVGLVADAVCRYRKYEDTSNLALKCRTFREYCEKIIGKSQWYVSKIIDAAKTTIALLKAGCPIEKLPTCEAQARPLAKIYKQATQAWNKFWNREQDKIGINEEPPPFPSEVLVNSWNKVLTEVRNICDMTANKITEILEDKPNPKKEEKVAIPVDPLEKLRKAAHKLGMSLENYLDAVADGTLDQNNKVEDVPEEKLESWEADLDQLTEEYGKQNIGRIAQSELPNIDQRIASNGTDYRYSGGIGSQRIAEGDVWQQQFDYRGSPAFSYQNQLESAGGCN